MSKVAKLHDDEVEIDSSLVARLLAEQFPKWADGPVQVVAAWEASLAADTWDGPPRWIHGDLMPGNVLVTDGKLSAVIDFGTAWAADPAADLLAAWYLFEGESRRAFRDAMEVDQATWARARAWIGHADR